MPDQVLGLLRENALFIVVLLLIVSAFVFLRTKGADLESADELNSLLAAGQPVVIEFFSNT
jgi:hypothetical protein